MAENIASKQALSSQNLVVPAVYGGIFRKKESCIDPKDFKKYYILSSGRISGKTSILVAKWWQCWNEYPDRDIIILQATATEIQDSIINEIKSFLQNSNIDVGENPTNEFYIPKKHNLVSQLGHKGKTYIRPITDSSGGQRTRGIKTENPLSLVLFEEVQKNKDANVVKQAIATFIRQIDDEAKMIIVGNNETRGHWFVDFCEEYKKDDAWAIIYANCFDIWDLLNEPTHEYILSQQKNNPIEFERVFMGNINAVTSDIVIPQFNRQKHYKRIYEIEDADDKRIELLFIGIDHATANDTFAAVPVAVLNDGTCMTLEVMYDDPKETNRVKSPMEQCDLLEDFMEFLDDKYAIYYNMLDVIMSVDGAAATFISQLRHKQKTARRKRTLWKQIKIKSFTAKKKDVNLGIIRNAFAYDVLTILNEGTRQWSGDYNKHRLAKEIEGLRYNDAGKLDPKIPNDLTDALEYGLIPYYSNCYNLSFSMRLERYKETSHYDDITKLL